jgi:hypothetical protein
MVADIFTPIGPAVLVFQLEDLLDRKISGVRGTGKMHHPEPAAAYISYGIAGLQVFPLRYTGNGAVKMDRNSRKLVGNRGGYILDRFAANGAIRNRYRFRGYLGRGPAGAFKKQFRFLNGGTPADRAALLS